VFLCFQCFWCFWCSGASDRDGRGERRQRRTRRRGERTQANVRQRRQMERRTHTGERTQANAHRRTHTGERTQANARRRWRGERTKANARRRQRGERTPANARQRPKGERTQANAQETRGRHQILPIHTLWFDSICRQPVKAQQERDRRATQEAERRQRSGKQSAGYAAGVKSANHGGNQSALLRKTECTWQRVQNPRVLQARGKKNTPATYILRCGGQLHGGCFILMWWSGLYTAMRCFDLTIRYR